GNIVLKRHPGGWKSPQPCPLCKLCRQHCVRRQHKINGGSHLLPGQEAVSIFLRGNCVIKKRGSAFPFDNGGDEYDRVIHARVCTCARRCRCRGLAFHCDLVSACHNL